MEALHDPQITEIIQNLTFSSQQTSQLTTTNHLTSILQHIYTLTSMQLQQLSGAMYGKTQIFQHLLSQPDTLMVVSLRVIYALVQTQITCADFVLVNAGLIDQLVSNLVENQPKETTFPHFTGAQGPEFGTFFDENSQIHLDISMQFPQLADASGAVLETVARHSSQGRQIIQNRIPELFGMLRDFSIFELFQPFRLMHVVNVLNYMVLFSDVDILQFDAISVLNAFSEKVFYNNVRSLDFLINKSKEQMPEKSQCQIFSKDGKLVYKSDDLYSLKMSLLCLGDRVLNHVK